MTAQVVVQDVLLVQVVASQDVRVHVRDAPVVVQVVPQLVPQDARAVARQVALAVEVVVVQDARVAAQGHAPVVVVVPARDHAQVPAQDVVRLARELVMEDAFRGAQVLVRRVA